MEYKLPPSFAGVRIFSSERQDGPMNWANREGRENLARFLRQIGATKPLCTAGQPHRTAVRLILKPGRYEEADGLLTSQDFTLGVKTADCVPLILFEKKSKILRGLHVSRLNLLQGIINQGLKSTLRQAKTDPQSLAAYLGPHIRIKNYPLKEEAISMIYQTSFARFLHRRSGRVHFDLTAALQGELEALGIKRENIIDCGIDTYADRRFFSSRRRQDQTAPVETFATVSFRK